MLYTRKRQPAAHVLASQSYFADSSFSQYRDIIGGRKNLDASRDPDHAPFKVDLSSICWDFI